MGNRYRITYGVDMVFCIDISRYMEPELDRVKRQVSELYLDVKRSMEARGRVISRLRARIILFRDYLGDGKQAMMVTDFFEFPAQKEQFREAVQGIEAGGGGIASSQDGLEALAFAIKTTPWDRDAVRRVHLIVVYSNNPAHPLGYGARSPYYPKGMARDFEELTSWWGSKYTPGLMDEYAKCMILFAPDAPGWREIRNNWNKVLHYKSDAGDGLPVCDYDAILSIICKDL